MNKKGFTLVELLVVIAILALLVIIALPNVLSMFNNAKKDLFLTEAKNVFKESAKKYISDNMHNSNEGNIYCKSETDSKNPLDMDIENTYYYIEKDSTGKTIKFVAWNSSGYVTKIVGDNVMLNDVTGNNVSESSAKDITCNNVLTNLEVEPKLTRTYTISASASYPVTYSTITISIDSSSTTDEFNKVRYVLYRKNSSEKFVKVNEFVQTNKSENFKLSYDDYDYEDVSLWHLYYKVEAYTENNLKIGEKEFENHYCFVAGTKVKTENGYKNIEDIINIQKEKNTFDNLQLEKLIKYELSETEDKNIMNEFIEKIRNIEGGNEIMTNASRIINNEIRKQRREGKIEGIAEGKAEGKAEGIALMAKKLKGKMHIKDISQITGLSEEEIKAL